MEEKKLLIHNCLWTILYAIFTLLIVLHHEIWADEAQAWMLAKNLSLPGLFKHLVNEGHPSFFYLLIMPFAKLNFSIFSMQILCWLSSCAAVFLLFQFSPFNRFAKFAIITSAGFLYFFPVIARSYSILPVLVFLAAILFPKRIKHPIFYTLTIAAIANTHIIMFAFAFLLGIESLFQYFTKEKTLQKQYIIPSVIIAAGLLAVVMQLHNTTASNVFISLDFDNLLLTFVKVVGLFFINSFDNFYLDFGRIMFGSIGIVAVLFSVVLYFMLFAILYANDKKLFLIALLSIMAQFVIYVIGYNHWIFVTRIFCAHIILLFCFWILLQKPDFEPKIKYLSKKFINTILAIFFILTFINGIKCSLLDLFNNYSGAKETALFIESNINKNTSLLVTDNDPHTIALVYYLDKKYEIYSAMHDRYYKYIVWDDSLYHILNGEGWSEYVKYMKQQNNNDFKTKKIYAVVPSFDLYKLGVKSLKDFKLIYESKPALVRFEGFRIFEYTGK